MKIKDLKPAEYNPRKITDEQLERLTKALHEFGDLSGIVFNCKTGNLIGGHQRLKCLPPDAVIKKEKLKKPSRTGTVAAGTITIDNESYAYREVAWDEIKEKAANIAANQHGGEWDDDKLAELLKELSETPDFDIDLTGFDDKEISGILSSIAGEGLTDPDEVPEVTKAITKTGDLWLLGSHRLLCGDATKKEDVEKLMDGKKADMVFTDPPYGIDVVKGNKIGGGGPIGGKIVNLRLYRKIIGDDKPFEPAFLLSLAKTIISWGANCYASKLPDNPGWIVWNKGTNPGVTFSSCELAWVNTGTRIKSYDYKWAGLTREGNRKDELKVKVHPTQKPVNLITQIFADYSGNLILDLFLGSGSTLIACEKTGRICYGMEIDPHYCDVIIKRWEDFTGKKAMK